jgi:hypothetical protein
MAAVAVLLLCVAAVGCLAFPSKMTMRRYGSGGTSLQNKDVDLGFIQVGVTTRDEISKKLGAIDVNAPTRFFWGRWVESSWGVVGGSLPLSSSAAPVVGGTRHWRYRNVLVQFNERGIATEQRAIDNDEVLWRQLIGYMRESHTPWPSETIRVPSTERTDSYAILSSDGIQLKAPNKKNSLTVTLPSPVTVHLRPRFRPQTLSTPELTCFEMNIADAGVGQKRSFKSCASARQFLAILAYLDHLPTPAKWHEKP